MAHFHIIAGADERPVFPLVRRIGIDDLKDALARGIDDFLAMPSHVVFLSLIYPIVGLLLGRMTLDNDVMPLLFPLMGGFALIGPFAAIGLYEMSRRREMGLDLSWKHAFDVLKSPSIAAIGAVAFLLMGIFVCWLATAQAIYHALFGPMAPQSIGQFLGDVFATSAGRKLIVFGNLAGLVFAVIALTVSVVSFPLLLDRDVGAAVAVITSARAVMLNPVTMAAWGLIVAAGLVLGSIPLFVGLAVVMPVLGHATWHLYRKVVQP
jgi:uncharacterized membrane protein